MKIELWMLFLAGVIYLGGLFYIAAAAERGDIPERLIRHPAVYALSLGVYATSWSYYGSVGFAEKGGFGFITIYIGVTIAFLLTPLLMSPVLRLVREYQLTSLADLLAFRYRGISGFVVTVFMLIGVLPYISLQIRAVSESIRVITQEVPTEFLAQAFCVTLTVFAILFGARHLSPREKHEGLVVAIAFESAVKLAALLMIGLFAVYGVFGGFNGIDNWLLEHPEALDTLYQPVGESPWLSLIVLSFANAFLLPRMFHMAFTENLGGGGPRTAAWAFPLYLLLLNLPVIPILWAGQYLGVSGSPDFYVLGITQAGGNGLLTLLAFVGGVSAASAMVIVTTLSLAGMCMNHMFLPLGFFAGRPQNNLYRLLLWGKRIMIALIIAGGYGFYRVVVHNQGLAQLGLISFVAVAQFLPGVLALLFWPRATQAGFIGGLIAGALVWFGVLIVPLLVNSAILSGEIDLSVLAGDSETSIWTTATFWSLSTNAVFLVVISLLTRQSYAERESARTCSQQSLLPLRGQVEATSPKHFQVRLARVMGPSAAKHEVVKALDELKLDMTEDRPAELRLLRERVERNLSGLLGPVLARMIVDDRLQLRYKSHVALAESIRYMESRLEDSHTRMRGAMAELDRLRRFHRQVLYELPIGVCALGPENEIVLWNLAMEVLSGIDAKAALGESVADLHAPWNELLGEFIDSPDRHRHKQHLNLTGQSWWLNLHKAEFETPGLGEIPEAGGIVLLVEDRTEVETLEAGLAHSERLASIGRFAAGVAHEIGNPLTGIACLAQNLEDEPDRQLIDESIREILAQTERITTIVQSLLTFSHGENPSLEQPVRFALRHCIDEAIRLVRLSHAGKQVECDNLCDHALEVYGDRQRMLQVFVNLLSNACDASRPGDRVRVAAEASQAEIRIEVADQGSGIPEAIREQVFEPFFTTKNVGEGTGLGLSLVHNIIAQHDGQVRIEDNPRGGTTISLHLPRRSADAPPATAREASAP